MVLHAACASAGIAVPEIRGSARLGAEFLAPCLLWVSAGGAPLSLPPVDEAARRARPECAAFVTLLEEGSSLRRLAPPAAWRAFSLLPAPSLLPASASEYVEYVGGRGRARLLAQDSLGRLELRGAPEALHGAALGGLSLSLRAEMDAPPPPPARHLHGLRLSPP
jgi:hypothetical protein